jgi:hypothetical protein
MNHKTIITYCKFALLVVMMAGLLSCGDDWLEVTPKDQVTDATLWSTTGNADIFLNDIYRYLPDPWNGDDLEDNYTDDSMSGIPGRVSATTYNKGIYTPDNFAGYWSQYTYIRKCNVFIENVEASQLDAAWKKIRLAEARFLRAFFYHLLWTHYGGVPLITKPLDRFTQGDEIYMARNTDLETYQFMIDELTAIADDLPVKAVAGRASKGAALTLKGWLELFSASALKNPSNDKSKWATAAATFKQVMDLKAYSLFSDYETMFYEQNNNNVEVIFDRHYLGGSSTIGASREGLQGPWFICGNQKAWGGVDPTQDLVDEYQMSNGKSITDPESGYNPQDPYVNREKRFYQSVVYEGSTWLNCVMTFKQVAGNRNATDLADFNEATNTGYYLRKGLDQKYAINGRHRKSSASYIIFRYAEVLLSYAEAQNEAVGPDESVYDAVDAVRNRSELPPLPEGLNQDQMRTAIRRERRVELAFELRRWYDLIRWKLAEVNINRTKHAMLIKVVNNATVYEVINAPNGNCIFDPAKHYVWPIPRSAIDKNKNLVQNPGY